MDITLHLGAHRCATKTFQLFLWNNRAKLAKRGLTCWTPRRTRDGLLRGLLRDPELITVEDERLAIRSTGRVLMEMDRLARKGQRDLLISEENLIGTLRTNVRHAQLYPLLHERLRRFAPAFTGRRLKIGLCIRSYEDYWTSCLAHRVGRGAQAPSRDVLDFLTTQPRRWRGVVREVAATFPEAEFVVWPFERLAGRVDAQLDLLWDGDVTGLQQGTQWRNRSGSVRDLNTVMDVRGDKPIEDGLVLSDKRWMPFDEDQRSVLRAEYRRDLAWLKAGAEGFARYVDGWPTPATRPDRAELTRTPSQDAVLFGGRYDGIEKGLGRTGAS